MRDATGRGLRAALAVWLCACAAVALPACQSYEKTPGLLDYVLTTPRLELVVMGVDALGAGAGQGAGEGEGWESVRQRVVALVGQYQPEVLSVQGLSAAQVRELGEGIGGVLGPPDGLRYGVIARGAADGRDQGEHTAVWYRLDRLQLRENRTMWLSERPGQPGSVAAGGAGPATMAWARLYDGKSKSEVSVFAVAMDERSAAARRVGAGVIAQQVQLRAGAEGLAVVLGRFGQGEGAQELGPLAGGVRRSRQGDGGGQAESVDGWEGLIDAQAGGPGRSQRVLVSGLLEVRAAGWEPVGRGGAALARVRRR
ncbi:MAG: hypothetical protein C0513_02775 [Isosphaera sp.]|nr:hypothetical protein [Isosphaera sp.]